MGSRHVFLLGALGLTALAAALELRIGGTAAAVEVGPPPAIEGCELADVDGRLRCRFPALTPEAPQTMVVWLEGEDVLEPRVRLLTPLGARTLAHAYNPLWPAGAREDTGTQLVFDVGSPGVLEITGVTGSAQRRWVVELEAREPTPGLDAALEQWSGGAGEVSPALLDELAHGAEGAWAAARALELRAEALEGGGPDAMDAAVVAYEQAHARADAGEISLRCRLLRKLGHLHGLRRDARGIAEAEARMGECEALGLAHHHRQALNEGKQRLAEQRWGEAIVRLRAAARGAKRMQTPVIELSARASLAAAHAAVQQFDLADAELARALAVARDAADCEQVAALAGYAAAIAIERRRGQWPDDAPHVVPSEAIADVLAARCELAESTWTALVLQAAHADQQWGRHAAAAAWLEQAETHALTPEQQRYVASIRADIAISTGDGHALARAHDELAALLRRHPSAADGELLVQLDVVAARLAWGRGALAAAEASLRAAVVRQDELLRPVPLGLATSRVSARGAEPARLLVELQRQRGDLEGALCTARLLRNRDARMLMDAASLVATQPERHERLVAEVRATELAYHQLQVDDDGTPAELAKAKAAVVSAKEQLELALTAASGFTPRAHAELCAALPEPEVGELAVLFHQDPQQRWWIFEWSRDEPVRVHDAGFGPLPSAAAEVRARLLSPFEDRLAAATRIRLLASGATHHVTFEALPWDEDTTLEQRFVVQWGLDLPRRSPRPEPPAGPMRKVVVYTDPLREHESPSKLAKVDAMLAAVRRWGFGVVTLVDERASTEDVRALAPGAFVVFVGENGSLAELDVDNPACPDPRPAPDPEDPHAPPAGLLVNWTAIDVGTILTSEPPRVAVLESCATGPVDAPSLGGAVGLGHVLAAAGTEQVLVTRTKVCPEDAFAFVTALVDATAEHGHDLPRLLRAVRANVDPQYVHRVLVP